jgi:hypothetical protein
MEKKPSHFIDGQDEESIPTYPPPEKVLAGKPYIGSMDEYKKEWEASVGPNADEWWAKVSRGTWVATRLLQEGRFPDR